MPLAGYVHFDEMRVLNRELRNIQKATRASEGEGATKQQQSNIAGAFGTGLLMGMYAMCMLRDSGCKTAELLAINDNGKTPEGPILKSLVLSDRLNVVLG